MIRLAVVWAVARPVGATPWVTFLQTLLLVVALSLAWVVQEAKVAWLGTLQPGPLEQLSQVPLSKLSPRQLKRTTSAHSSS